MLFVSNPVLANENTRQETFTYEGETIKIEKEEISTTADRYQVYINERLDATVEIHSDKSYALINGIKVYFEMNKLKISSLNDVDDIINSRDLTEWTRIRHSTIYNLIIHETFHTLGVSSLAVLVTNAFLQNPKAITGWGIAASLINNNPYGNVSYMIQDVYARYYSQYKYVEKLYGSSGYIKTYTRITY